MGGWAGLIYEVKRAAPFSSVPGFGPLCRLLSPPPHPAPRFCDCVCAHCVFRLISLTLSCSDEAGQITLSAQPTQSVQNEEREQRSTVFPTVSLLVDVNSDLITAFYNLYYSKHTPLWKCHTAEDRPIHLFQIHLTVN